MTRRFDVRKRRQWEERFERHRSGGLTVADFCAKERVSVNTFYYWAKRIDGRSTAARSSASAAASERQRKLAEPARRAARLLGRSCEDRVGSVSSGNDGGSVGSGELLGRDSQPGAVAPGLVGGTADAFQEVVVGPR